MTIAQVRPLPRVGLHGLFSRRVRAWTAISSVTLFGIVLASAFLMPLAYMAATSLKDAAQLSERSAPLYPAKPATFEWEGSVYPVYLVPSADGVRRSIRMVLDGRLPWNTRCGTSESGVPSALTSSGVFPNARASVCANTFARSRS